MEPKKMTKISVTMTVGGEGSWHKVNVAHMEIDIDDPGSYEGLLTNIKNAMVAIRTHLDTMQRIDPNELLLAWKLHSAQFETERATEAKHKEGGEVWRAYNRANKAEADLACAQKQIDQLIAQLGRNIEQERKDGTL